MTGIYKRIHFIGIGGAGMSGIAKIFLSLGYEVSGSDLKESEALKRLRNTGATVHIGHKASNISGADIVVLSSAIPTNNPEYIEAIKSHIPVVHRADMLGQLMLPKKGIAVSGAHGKTTTTSMIAHILEKNGLDPTIIIGGEVNDIGGNANLGKGEFLVAEADESDGSFLKLKPYIAVITNIEDDHLDYYKNMDNMREAFKQFIENLKPSGFAVLGTDNENVRAITKSIKNEFVTYGIHYSADYMPKNIIMEGLETHFDLYFKGELLRSFELNVPGLHNVYNATAAIAVTNKIGIDIDGIFNALKSFHGVQRRFQIISKASDVTIIDDYAHHPTEIKATLETARACSKAKIYAIFQPHRYTRTKILADEFGEAFSCADEVIVTKIYSAGEKPIPGVTSQLIYDAVKKNGNNVTYIENQENIPDYLLKKLKPGDFAITIGAGDINKTAYMLAQTLREKAL
mgnify:CR=1 FL=1